jgi:shikimate kinase
MKIVLIGYMGSGKSTVGKLLADRLNLNFIDLDNYIEGKLKTKIAGIFKEKGEIYFRKKEHQYIMEILEKKQDLVIATGGGTPCYSGNMQAMLEKSNRVVYLMVSVSELSERLFKEKHQRPLIAHLSKHELPEFIGKHLLERSLFYSSANHTVICEKKSLQQIVREIEDLLI